MKPYYEHAGITIYHGDCREIMPSITADVLVTDPPYGIAYDSGAPRKEGNARSIRGDLDTSLRDWCLSQWSGPALVFGTWRKPKPDGIKGVLIWDKGGALGMGDLSLPWKLDHEEIYIVGSGFVGSRDCGSVLRFPPEQSMGRVHPHQKPVRMLKALLVKTVGDVLDTFAGSGSTLVAAKDLGRKAIGIEIEERYCEIAAKRLSQEVLDFGGAA